tara:strand:+ start:671 stop:1129 length:459 start_codon:yes stop_codon:yes gene_type:complete
MKKYFTLLLIIFFGCKPIEPVEFVEIKNVKIDNLKNNELKISADIILDNPNKVKITISRIDIGIIADDIMLVKINDNTSRELSDMSKSTINIKGDIDVKNLEKFLNQKGIAILLGDQNIILKFFGEIEVRAYGLKDLIEIDYSINNFKDLVK